MLLFLLLGSVFPAKGLAEAEPSLAIAGIMSPDDQYRSTLVLLSLARLAESMPPLTPAELTVGHRSGFGAHGFHRLGCLARSGRRGYDRLYGTVPA